MDLGTNIARMFAALSATNEAILYAKSQDELFQQVCDAALASGDFHSIAILLLKAGTSELEMAAGAGHDAERLRNSITTISVDAGKPEGMGLCGEAFRNQTPCISNDFPNDPRSRAWRTLVAQHHTGAAAAMPLVRNGKSIGVFHVRLREAGALNPQMVALLTRMSTNISFALDNFDRDAERKAAEGAMRRLNRMFGAI